MANWKGTPVPSSGQVDKIYFNTNLTKEEVISICSNLQYTISDVLPIYSVIVAANQELTKTLVIYYIAENNGVSCEIFLVTPDGEITIFRYNNIPGEEGVGREGWNEINSFDFNDVNVLSVAGPQLGYIDQNELLSELISSTPFVEVQEKVTLNSFLTDIADAIRSKKGTTDKINASNFASEIESIQTGIEPTGTLDITKNGLYNVREYENVNVDVEMKLEPVTNISLDSGGLLTWKAPDTSDISSKVDSITITYNIVINGNKLISDTNYINVYNYLVNGENTVSITAIANVSLMLNNEKQTVLEFEITSDTTELKIIVLDNTTPYAFLGAATVLVDNKGYIFSAKQESSKNGILEFDTTTETVTKLSATLPLSTKTSSAVLVGTNAYIFGIYKLTEKTDEIKKFDTTSKTLTTLSVTLPNAIEQPSAVLVGTNAYIFGGKTNSGYTNEIVKFDTTTETVTKLNATLPTAKYYASAVAIGNTAYIFGGSNGSGLKEIVKFDTTTETVTKLSTQFPSETYMTSAVLVGTNAYIFGGMNTTIYKFDTLTEILTTLDTTLPTKKRLPSAVLVGNTVYLLGANGTEILKVTNL